MNKRKLILFCHYKKFEKHWDEYKTKDMERLCYVHG